MKYPGLKHVGIEGSLSLPILRPFFESRAGSSLKTFQFSCSKVNQNGQAAMEVFPLLKSLEKLIISLDGIDHTEVSPGLLTQIPKTVRFLSISHVHAKVFERLTELLGGGDAFPVLEELYLSDIMGLADSGADLFCDVISTTAKAKLKALGLGLAKDTANELQWSLTSRMLGCHREVILLPKLERLFVGWVDWTSLAQSLLGGKLPSLIEVQDISNKGFSGSSKSFRDWYTINTQTSQLWGDALRQRPLLCLPKDVNFRVPSTILEPDHRVQDFLAVVSGMSDTKRTSCIQSLQLTDFGKCLSDQDSCTLAEAIKSGRFASL